jgi:AraC family transcriptional regulator
MRRLVPRFFHRAFKDTTGETPLAYIQRMRIQRAMELLASRDLSVLQLATKVGFLSPSHFSRLFQRQVGMTPSRYRQGRR